MEATRLLVQYHGYALHLEVLSCDVLGFAHNLLGNLVRPGLALPSVIGSNCVAFLGYNLLYDLFDLPFD